MDKSLLQLLAPAGACVIISCLAYVSQVFFWYTDTKLEISQFLIFNILVGSIWICFFRACWTSPGLIPKDWEPEIKVDLDWNAEQSSSANRRHRWCKKCEVFKPPRTHHCKTCNKCIPRMDHHCPWMMNCVSNRTLPHFIRFLFYAVSSMIYLEYFLFLRCAAVWNDRQMPSYLGPTVSHLITLAVLCLTNSITLFGVGIMFVRSIYSLCTNVTTIEGWEIDRHHALLRRARVMGGYLDGPNGVKIKIVKQEFPYDIGIYDNIMQGMNSNVLLWLWPFTRSPGISSGLDFETNGFEDPWISWPPPDPDRMPRNFEKLSPHQAFLFEAGTEDDVARKEAFRARQQQDLSRYRPNDSLLSGRKPFHKRFDLEDNEDVSVTVPEESADGDCNTGEEAWRNSDGETLKDFGVDEDVDFYDEDNVPLSELKWRRKNAT